MSADNTKKSKAQNIDAIYPLSFLQHGMLYHSMLSPDSGVYCVQIACDFTGDMDNDAFRRAWAQIIKRHDVFRTMFIGLEQQKARQVVRKKVRLPLEELDWRDLDADQQEREYQAFMATDLKRGFDFSKAPMMRFTLIRIADQQYRLIWNLHHAVIDGWSMPIVFTEFITFYESIRNKQRPQLPQVPQFKEYIAWLQRRDEDESARFWQDYLKGIDTPTPMMKGQMRDKDVEDVKPVVVQRLLSVELTAAIRSMSRQHEVTMNIVTQGAWGIMLSRHNRVERVLFGTTVSGRPAELTGMENMVGPFINSVPVRIDVPGEQSVVSCLAKFHATQIVQHEHSYTPLVDVHRHSEIAGNISLFDSLVVFENTPVDSSLEALTWGLEVTTFKAWEQTNFPLTIIFNDGEKLALKAIYNPLCFDAQTVDILLDQYLSLLQNMAEQPLWPVSKMSLLLAPQEQQLLQDWSDIDAVYPHQSTIHQLFEQQAEQTPDAIAVAFDGDELSYEALNEQANQLAHYLISVGVTPDTPVAICIERSLDMMVGVLGILKAGGAYVPIDPTYPEERIEFMLEDSAVDIVLSDMETMGELPLDEQQQFYLDEEFREQMLGSQSDENPAVELSDEHLAYVLYTSGSTGQPKGVCVPHRGVVRLVHDTDFVELNNDTHMLQMAPLGFDAATFEIWGPLLNGGQLSLYPQGPMDVLALSRFIKAQSINTLWLTSALFDQWIIEQDGPSGLSQLLVGGDVVSPHSVAQLYAMDDQVQIINGYGPTEGTTFTCCYAIPRAVAGGQSPEGQSIPIGKGIKHTQVYVLDEGQLVLPHGVAGELYIGGAGLARGYLNQDALTEAAFITSPLAAHEGQRLYRTGDLVRWLPDGQLEFIGRVDHQVKIRGFRIELGEIEARINQNPDINEAVVVVLGDDNGDKQLVAYVTFAIDDEDYDDEDEDDIKEAQRATIERIKTTLKSALPDYMVPAIFVILEKMPLTNNGKIDRKALPAPGEEDRQKQEYVAPTGELQQSLCEMWQEVLSLQQVGVEDDFFELGGHSLLATRVVSRIRQEMNVEIPLRILFEQPTITALAQEIETLESASVLPPIEKVGENEDKLLSYSQQRLWFIDQLEGGSAQYNMPVVFRMDGELSEQAVRQAFEQILTRHEVIRTRLISEQGQVVQQVQQQYDLPLSMVDLSDLSESEQTQRIQVMGKADAAKAFNLSEDILLRVTLLKLSEHSHVMLFNMHHIASDGWSMALLIAEFSQLYSAFREGRENPLEPLKVQYVDYANWQRKCFEGELLEQQLGYWTEQLADIPAMHSLPLDKPRPAQQSFNGKLKVHKIDEPLTKQLNGLCKQQGVTLFMLLQTAYSVLLGRYSNTQDIVLGSPIAGRMHQDVEPLIGFFLNTLALRTKFDDAPAFSDLLQTNKKMILDAYDHQIVPFDMLVEALKPPRSLSHSPVFQLMFVLQNNEHNELDLSGLTLTPVKQDSTIVKFDLELSITEVDGTLNTVWLYNDDLFFEDTIIRLAQSFETLLEGIVKTPAQTIDQLPLVNPAQAQQLLVDFNDTPDNYPQDQSIAQLFEQQVALRGDNVALEVEGEGKGEAQTLTYNQLNQRANGLAHYLIGRGVTADTPVGLFVERSVDMIVGMLAILKAGGAYVPLDPEYPQTRLTFMLKDCGADIVLTQSALLGRFDDSSADFVCIDAAVVVDGNADSNKRNPEVVRSTPANLAYVIYTSGSTGQPKGVMVPQLGVVRLVIDAEFVPLGEDDVLAQASNCSFDAATFEIWGALLNGARLHFIGKQKLLDPIQLAKTLQDGKVTTLFITTAVFNQMAQIKPDGFASLRFLLFGGEMVDVSAVSAVIDAGKPEHLLHMYGPTESTTFTSYYPVPKTLAAGISVPIGSAIDGTNLYVLSSALTLVPVGGLGELYVGGDGLARGYLNQPLLSEAAFIENPFGDNSNQRLYKTGDLVRWLPGGQLEFVGRVDDQVKIRGFRIELGEIEVRLTDLSLVKDAVVLARKDAGQQHQLVAYVVFAEQQSTDDKPQDNSVLIGDIKTSLLASSPDYMVPSTFVIMDILPLTANGKVDRKALPAPADEDRQGGEYLAPTNDIEQKMCEIWQQLLGLEKVGISDDFFALGGHSLLATRVISEIRDEFDVELPLRTLFEQPTIAQLAQEIDGNDNALVLPDIVPVARDENQPLSFAQQRLWFIDQLEGSSVQYNMPVAFALEGTLDVDAFKETFKQIVMRHEVLRTRLVSKEGEARQLLQETFEVPIVLKDISDLADTEQTLRVKQTVAEDMAKPFDLSTDIFLRVQLLKLSPTSHVVAFNMHHIASDGWSIGLLVNEFSQLYSAFCQGQANPLPPLAVQYGDYAHWQRQWLQGDILAQQLGYWTEQLSGLPTVHSLPLDKPRPAQQTFTGQNYQRRIDAPLTSRINVLCQQKGVTLFMLMQTAFSVLLSRYSQETDIVMGSPIAGRLHKDVEPLVGFFINNLVLRTDLDGAPAFSDLLQANKKMILDAYSYQSIPFEMLVEAVKPQRSLSHGALFQVAFVVQNIEQQELELPGLTLKPVEQDNYSIKFDLQVSVSEIEDVLSVTWTYNDDLFLPDSVARMMDNFTVLLSGIVQNPDHSVNRLPLLSDVGQRELLTRFASPLEAYPTSQCIHQLFEQRAEQTPDAVAVTFDGDPLSYGELNEEANQLAHYLISVGVTPDTLVAICIERSLDMMVGVLGILKAGGAYVPIDPAYPDERIEFMLEDSAVDIVLSDMETMGELPLDEQQQFYLDSDFREQMLANQPDDNPVVELDNNNLAYVIYTSGSTGQPKGVCVPHRGVVRLVHDTDFVTLDNNTHTLQMAPLSFDAATFEIWGPLLNGGQLTLYPSGPMDVLALSRFIASEKINTAWLTSALFDQWTNEQEGPSGLRQLLVGGDIVNPVSVAKLYGMDEQIVLINGYGPTEGTTFTCCYPIPRDIDVDQSVPIGKAISHTQVYVLDEHQQVVPEGVPGELYIGGAGLARGYLNQDELTAAAFITCAVAGGDEQRLYRTGDLVRWLPSGKLGFIGRIDQQVKLRGFRIELGEIQWRINQHNAVTEAVVVLFSDDNGEKQLVAYVTLEAEQEDEVQSESIKAMLKSALPDYMVPSIFVTLAAMPLTANGKIDRKALPAPGEDDRQKRAYVAPTGEVETTLCEMWQDVLSLQQVGVEDDFFELGGHSLLATRVISRIRQEMSVELPLRVLFEQPTVTALALEIDKLESGSLMPDIMPVAPDENLPLSYSQQRLWFIDKLESGSTQYNMPMVFELNGELDTALVTAVFSTIVERHEVLRTVYVEQGGEALQLIRSMADITFEMTVEDLSQLKAEALDTQLKRFIQDEMTAPFDLTKDLMLRVSYVKKTADTGVMIFNMHHIASDGWSMAVLNKEFFALAQAYKEGQANPLPELEIQYADYAYWQRKYLTGEVLESQLNFWQEQLAELPAVHSLPLDYERPQVKQNKGARVATQLSATVAKQLLGVAKQHKLTAFMLLHGALSLVLSRHSNSGDVVVGTPVANRLRAKLDPLIGFFVNTLVLRADTNQDSMSDFFAHIRQVHLDAQSNQDVPFEQLVERLKAPRSAAHSPLFQIMISANTDYGVNDDQDNASFGSLGVDIQSYESDYIQAKFDLELDVNISEEGAGLIWTYDISLFSQTHIEQLNDHLCRLLDGLTQTQGWSTQVPFALPLLSDGEVQHLVSDLNDTTMDYAKEDCIHQLFERQAANNPNSVAVMFEDRQRVCSQLTYQQLNEKANQLAHYLKEHHDITPDTLVGVCVERSLEMVIGIMAILKAGGAYVPLDSNYPQDRLNYMLEDAALDVVLSHSNVQSALTGFNGTVIKLDGLANTDEHCCTGYDNHNLTETMTGLTASNLAYVIYTSGSTGQPKGVMVEHQNMVNFNLNIVDKYQMTGSDRVLQFSTMNFDIFVEECFGSLSNGATLVLRNEACLSGLTAFNDFCSEKGITVMSLPTAFWHQLNSDDGLINSAKLRLVILGGEALQQHIAKKVVKQLPNIQLLNTYGPTETTVTASSYCVNDLEDNCTNIPIGKPNLNNQLLVLDSSLCIVPKGAHGELYIGGDGLARGYLNRADLTAEHFITNPFYDEHNANSSPRLYKTGDLVRYLADGNLEFIGRADGQVKIRGFRVELSEVELQLSQLDVVDSACVIAKELAGSLQLVGYIKPPSTATLDNNQIAQYVAGVKATLAKQLPGYMVPGIMMVVEQWPLTANGKLDKAALPMPDGSVQQGEYIAPVTETEQVLVDIWATLLNIEAGSISIKANFFDLGGHSLLTVKLLSLIQIQLKKACELSTLFVETTIKSQAAMLDSLEDGLGNTALLQIVTQKVTQKVNNSTEPKEGIVFIPGVASTANDFTDIVAQLQQNYAAKGEKTAPVEMGIFRHQGLIAGEQFFDTMAGNVSAFVDSLAQWSVNKVTLVGHSYGGALAMALANELQANNYQVELVMLDTYFEQPKLTVLGGESAAQEVDLTALDLPSYLQDVFKHQSTLFDEYEPTMSKDLSATLVFANQSQLSTSQYKNYLADKPFAQQISYADVAGDHFSMLKGDSARVIAGIIADKAG